MCSYWLHLLSLFDEQINCHLSKITKESTESLFAVVLRGLREHMLFQVCGILTRECDRTFFSVPDRHVYKRSLEVMIYWKISQDALIPSYWLVYSHISGKFSIQLSWKYARHQEIHRLTFLLCFGIHIFIFFCILTEKECINTWICTIYGALYSFI